jgi:hypothetical protein
MSGWIKLHRQMLESDLWKSEPFTRAQVWIDLLLLANHSKGFIRARGVRIDVDRGQVGMSQVVLSKRWKWSRGKTKRFLDELEMDQQIVQQKNNVSSLITITNYSRYQGGDTADNTANGQQTEQQTVSKRYTNKKNNNNKEEKEQDNKEQEKKKEVKTIQKRIDDFKILVGEVWKQSQPDMSKEMVRDFFDYWAEHGPNDTKLRFEKEKTFGLSRRMSSWKKNNFNNNQDSAPVSNLYITPSK